MISRTVPVSTTPPKYYRDRSAHLRQDAEVVRDLMIEVLALPELFHRSRIWAGWSRRAPWSARRRSAHGRQDSAIAIMTLWRMPPDIVLG